MNLDNLKTLIETVKEAIAKDAFDINNFTHRCGSPGCIAGYAALLQHSDKPSDITYRETDFYVNSLAEYLSITYDEAREISLGFEQYIDRNVTFRPSPDKALMYLEEMYIYEGVMCWDEVFSLDSVEQRWED